MSFEKKNLMTESLVQNDWLQKYECVLLMQETSEEELRGLEKTLPTDTHLVLIEKEGELYADAVRAYKMSDIFDAYYDEGYKVNMIQRGFGRIRPNLYANQQEGGQQ